MAPSAENTAAVARPMPCAAPVMTTTLSSIPHMDFGTTAALGRNSQTFALDGRPNLAGGMNAG